jgi:hypothetical protein
MKVRQAARGEAGPCRARGRASRKALQGRSISRLFCLPDAFWSQPRCFSHSAFKLVGITELPLRSYNSRQSLALLGVAPSLESGQEMCEHRADVSVDFLTRQIEEGRHGRPQVYSRRAASKSACSNAEAMRSISVFLMPCFAASSRQVATTLPTSAAMARAFLSSTSK